MSNNVTTIKISPSAFLKEMEILDSRLESAGIVATVHVVCAHGNEDFGKEVKRLREKKGLGLRELGRLAKISAGRLSQIENGIGVGFPSEETLRRLATKLDTDAAQLIALARKLPSYVEAAAIDCILRNKFTEDEMIQFLESYDRR